MGVFAEVGTSEHMDACGSQFPSLLLGQRLGQKETSSDSGSLLVCPQHRPVFFRQGLLTLYCFIC